MHGFVSLDLSSLDPMKVYSLLTNAVQPRPIAFVSTVSQTGIPNLAPFSFFMVGGANPASVMISPVLGKGEVEKDSLVNIRETREFVVNTVHREMAEGMNLASKSIPPDENEWELAGFTPLPSEIVLPARVSESLIQMECQLFQIIEHGSGPLSARYILGEIVRVHVSDSVWNGEGIDPEKVQLISRLGGNDYLDCQAMDRFQLARP